MKSFLMSLALSLSLISSASAAVDADNIKKTLSTFNAAINDLVVLDTIGELERCELERSIWNFANAIEKDAVDYAVNSDDGELTKEGKSFREAVADARESECITNNDQCCIRSSDSARSDRCLYKPNKNCTLTGVRIQGCTDTSVDCN